MSPTHRNPKDQLYHLDPGLKLFFRKRLIKKARRARPHCKSRKQKAGSMSHKDPALGEVWSGLLLLLSTCQHGGQYGRTQG